MKYVRQKKTNTILFHFYVDSKHKIKKQYRNKPIDTDNKLMNARWEEGWGMCEKGGGIKKYTFPVINIATGV